MDKFLGCISSAQESLKKTASKFQTEPSVEKERFCIGHRTV